MRFDDVREYVARGDLEHALRSLSENAAGRDGEASDTVTLLLSRLSLLEQSVALGIVAAEAASAQRNQIAQSILRVSRNLCVQDELIHTTHSQRSVEPNLGAGTGRSVSGSFEPVPRVVRLFLASSIELADERDAFDLYVRQQNDRLRQRGIYIQVVRWERGSAAMSSNRLQDAYNEQIRQSELFVALFFTKAGEITGEELGVARSQFLQAQKPLIFTYFKDGNVRAGSAPPEDRQSLLALQDELKRQGHYWSRYTTTEDLHLKFREQLDQLFP